LGVIFIKVFDSCCGFEVIDFEIAIFGKISPGYIQNHGSDQKDLYRVRAASESSSS